MTKGIVYYSDCRIDPVIADTVRAQIVCAAPRLTIASCTLNQWVTWPIGASGQPLMIEGKRGYLSMFRQILIGLEALTTDIAFLCEHDVLYHRAHFGFTPPRSDVFYYNQNVWKVRASDGHALHYPCSQTSGLCANRALLVEHYRRRIAMVEEFGFSRAMGFEPGTHRRPERVDDYGSATWMSAVPNIDIRHDANLTESRWTKAEFRNARFTEGWTEGDGVPGWGLTAGRFREFLRELSAPGVAA